MSQAPWWAWAALVPLLAAEGAVFAVQGSTATDAELAREGAHLFQTRQCTGCHQLDGRGQAIACDLDRVGRRRHKAWLRQWLLAPQAVRPGTAMPDPGLTHAEAVALAEYLARRQ